MKKTYLLLIMFLISISSFTQIIDTQVITNANTYLNHNWNASSSNIWNNIDCGGKIVNTPEWVSIGSHTSLPYCWGGNSTISAFDNYLTQGNSAGDDNTNVNFGAEPSCSVGVDCSGYVSRCYGLSTHYSTTMLNSNSLFGHHNSYNDLKAGDFVNKPGSHTRLVTQINNNGTITFLESGSGTGNVGSVGLWKVFQWTYSVSTLINEGYNPQFYTNMTTNGGNPPDNDNCIDAENLESNLICSYISGTVDNATGDGINVPSCDNLSTAPKEVWYQFTPAVSTNTITVSPNNAMNAVIAVYSGNNCTSLIEIGCDGAVSGGLGDNVALTYNSFNIGQLYWIRVYDYGNIDPTNGDFEICITHSNTGGTEDITLSNEAISSSTIVNAGDTVNAEVDQNYSGNSNTVPNVYLHYYLSSDCVLDGSDVLLYDGDWSSIDASNPYETENETLTIPSETSSGTYYILFVGDATDVVNESNENNNTACIQITVNSIGGSEDITLSNEAISSSTTVNAGGTVDAEVDQNYSGNSNAVPSVYLHYYLSSDCVIDASDVLLYDGDWSSIDASNPYETENETLTIPSGTNSGIYYILFVGDATDVVSESNENNNTACLQITVNDPLSFIDYDFQQQLLVYPNPTSNFVNITSSLSLAINKLYVYDLNGRLLKENEGTNLSKINLSELTNGIYILKVVSDENKKAVFRIIKK